MLILCVLDRISMYGDVVTIYGSAPQSESSYWLGEQHYEVRLSATVRPIDGHNSLMWGKSDLQRKSILLIYLYFCFGINGFVNVDFFFKYVNWVIFVHCSMQWIYFWEVISIYFILKVMFNFIGEHLILRRNYLIEYFKKRLRKTLSDAIRVSIAVIWKEFCLRLKMSILIYTLSDKSTLLSLYCFKSASMKHLEHPY